ncbi:hypothetical protein Lesp02_76050 [Lentzea sp. NBRC 105346]|uniref:IniB N-terminal domain-containing protein n=1 Tax=Lentzea sp. NBRC 105346 TaxID=3032205 RepID=UPI0024A098EF|nr:IniB N-terminal domain-containing protein [Lentzea sp. NBRC 105346]GLZ35418.1 hypothetical protein Lesp02_76050 [Lentzea sp. NBRC 105346]
MTSLLEFILNLLRDPVMQEQFKANPQQALRDHGFDEVCAQDVHDALPLVVDNVQVSGPGGGLPAAQPGEDHLEVAIRQIDHIVNNYSYTDSHDTYADYSVNQTIWTQGDVNQSFDNDMDSDTIVVSDSTVVNGDENVVGDDSTQVDVHSFGRGDVSVNTGSNSETDSHNTVDEVSTTDSHDVTHQAPVHNIEHDVVHENVHEVTIDHTHQHGLVNVDDALNDLDVLSDNDVDVLNGLHL